MILLGSLFGILITLCASSSVDLSNKNITSISDITIQNHATKVHLENNLIRNITANELQDLPYLTHLYLEKNHIEFLADYVFLGICNITYLNIESNKLSNLTNKTFYGLTQLKTLVLHDNSLSELGGVFSPLTSLEVLSFGANEFLTLKSEFFIGLENLKKIVLDASWKLTEIEDFALSNLKHLDNIWLWGNKLKVIETNDLKGLVNLRTFTPGYSYIKHIEELAFSDLVNLNGLYMRWTEIESLSINIFNASNRPSINTVDLLSSKWRCDIDLCWMRSPENSWFNLQYDFTCASPPSLAGRMWSSLTDTDLCCQTQCKCNLHH